MLLLLPFIVFLGHFSLLEGKIYERCELANQLQYRFGLPLHEVAVLLCIAQHTSDFNTAFSNSDSHGIFQISDAFWCDKTGGFGGACGLSCARLRDNDIADDVLCVRKIHAEHQRLSGDGFTAWQAYGAYCRQDAAQYLNGCAAGNAAVALKTSQSVSYYQNRIPPVTIPATIPSRITPSYYPTQIQTRGKIYQRCELAQELYYTHKMPMQQIPTWVCIAKHESSFNTAAVGRLNADGSADHGLFQISDLFWCSHDAREGGKGCRASCSQFLDSNISDDVQCIKKIYREHKQISGDGFNAWTVYQRNCRNQGYEQVANCFKNSVQISQPTYQQPNSIGFTNQRIITPTSNPYYRPPPPLLTYQPQPKQDLSPYQGNPFLRPHYSAQPQANALVTATAKKGYTQYTHPFSQAGKVYKRCELAQELHFSHKFPMQDIATWVCIAEHESSFNTAAVGRLNADGSADHGLFQISDLYWCGHDGLKAKGCNLACDHLLDGDITDDVECIKTIHKEHTRLSGDGFTAWTVYPLHCKNRRADEVAACFDSNTISSIKDVVKAPAKPQPKPRGKIYQRCELAQDLYYKHKMPMQQIPTWVCIAEHESSFNTAAVGRLNSDGSLDHGLFQISDLYWCSHGNGGGKACNIECDRFLDADIADDVKCVKTIYDEHTRISGDGFNAWTVYPGHCKHQSLAKLSDCFQGNEIIEADHQQQTLPKLEKHHENVVETSASHRYSGNPFLQNVQSAAKPPRVTKPAPTVQATNFNPQSNAYNSNPFLQRVKPQESSKWQSKPSSVSVAAPFSSANNYANNPFLKVPEPSVHGNSLNHLEQSKPSVDHFNYASNPVLNILAKPLVPTAVKPSAVASTTKSPPHQYLQQPARPYISSDSFRHEVIKFTATSVAAPKITSTTAAPTTNFPVWSWQNYLQTSAGLSTARQTTTRYSVPTTTRPTTGKPTTARLTTAKSISAKTTTTARPTTTRPTTARPTTARPTTARPTTARPTTARPTTARPTTARPTTARPTTAGPTTARPTTARPTTTRYFASRSTTTAPTTTSRTITRPSTTPRPITTRPTTTRPTTIKATTARPTPTRYYRTSTAAVKNTTPRTIISSSFHSVTRPLKTTTFTTKTTSRPTAQAPSTTTRPTQRSTTPKPYLFTSTTIKTSTSDPFSHPFFQKFKERFERPSSTITTSSRNPTTTTSSPYYARYQENKLKVAAKTVYSYDFGQNRTTPTTTTTRKPSSAFDLYLKWNKN
ncbi:uncharacterized protein LOC6643158 isoform X2 [Drosophila willistoni]|uniref:uncharacterized protein LOC6643158 isoform X2 n=1 Tax=Drosophila willistoni TaxID=7260 RepID=UPI000C26C529|nr:uncharacterized protein LOC6643158 isoform X2 [Drosophila willistoni]